MLRRLWGDDIPAWAAPEHNPLLRYEYMRQQSASSSLIQRLLKTVLAITLLLSIGYGYASLTFPDNLQVAWFIWLWRVLIIPLVVIQVFTRALATLFAFHILPAERQRQTWDARRVTLNGASLSIYSWWLAILWRVRHLLLIGFLGRGLLVLGICYEVTRLHGVYLDLLTARALPTMPFVLGVVMLSAFLTALILSPILLIGTDIALALWLSVRVRNRALLSILQVLIVSAQILLSLGLCAVALQTLTQDVSSGWYGTLTLSISAVFADNGVILAQLTQAGELWARLPYSAFIGGVMLLAMMMQLMGLVAILRQSVRRAEAGE